MRMKTLGVALALVALIAAGIFAFDRYEIAYAPAPRPACAVNTCPMELTQADSGGTFTYTETSRFSVFLDEKNNPQARLHCVPEGVIGYISNIAPPPAGLYSMRYEGIAPGTCTLSDTNFKATIVIVPLSSS